MSVHVMAALICMSGAATARHKYYDSHQNVTPMTCNNVPSDVRHSFEPQSSINRSNRKEVQKPIHDRSQETLYRRIAAEMRHGIMTLNHRLMFMSCRLHFSPRLRCNPVTALTVMANADTYSLVDLKKTFRDVYHYGQYI